MSGELRPPDRPEPPPERRPDAPALEVHDAARQLDQERAAAARDEAEALTAGRSPHEIEALRDEAMADLYGDVSAQGHEQITGVYRYQVQDWRYRGDLDPAAADERLQAADDGYLRTTDVIGELREHALADRVYERLDAAEAAEPGVGGSVPAWRTGRERVAAFQGAGDRTVAEWQEVRAEADARWRDANAEMMSSALGLSPGAERRWEAGHEAALAAELDSRVARAMVDQARLDPAARRPAVEVAAEIDGQVHDREVRAAAHAREVAVRHELQRDPDALRRLETDSSRTVFGSDLAATGDDELRLMYRVTLGEPGSRGREELVGDLRSWAVGERIRQDLVRTEAGAPWTAGDVLGPGRDLPMEGAGPWTVEQRLRAAAELRDGLVAMGEEKLQLAGGERERLVQQAFADRFGGIPDGDLPAVWAAAYDAPPGDAPADPAALRQHLGEIEFEERLYQQQLDRLAGGDPERLAAILEGYTTTTDRGHAVRVDASELAAGARTVLPAAVVDGLEDGARERLLAGGDAVAVWGGRALALQERNAEALVDRQRVVDGAPLYRVATTDAGALAGQFYSVQSPNPDDLPSWLEAMGAGHLLEAEGPLTIVVIPQYPADRAPFVTGHSMSEPGAGGGRSGEVVVAPPEDLDRLAPDLKVHARFDLRTPAGRDAAADWLRAQRAG